MSVSGSSQLNITYLNFTHITCHAELHDLMILVHEDLKSVLLTESKDNTKLFYFCNLIDSIVRCPACSLSNQRQLIAYLISDFWFESLEPTLYTVQDPKIKSMPSVTIVVVSSAHTVGLDIPSDFHQP
jgi:hypothetical protein